MGWLIGAAVVLGGVLLLGQARRRGFAFRGRRYRRHGDGGFTYADGGTIDDAKERADVEAHWHDSHSSDSGSGDSGSGDGGDGGGGD